MMKKISRLPGNFNRASEYPASESIRMRQIVIVAHGGVLTGLVRGLCRDPDLAQLDARPCRNCSISEFGAWLEGDQPRIRLRHWAGCDHLS